MHQERYSFPHRAYVVSCYVILLLFIIIIVIVIIIIVVVIIFVCFAG